jgi:hypothetical protein
VFPRADRPTSIQSDRSAIRRDRFRSEKDAQHVESGGKLLFEEVCERNLEGMVCKAEGERLRGAWLGEDQKSEVYAGRSKGIRAFDQSRNIWRQEARPIGCWPSGDC